MSASTPMRWLVAALVLVGVLSAGRPAPAAADDCGDLPVSVSCGTSADPESGSFHGLIGVTGQDWVLSLASHSGDTAGCGDCVWTIALDCPLTAPGNPDSSVGCGGFSAGSRCPADELPFNLYLTTATVVNELVGLICLGGRSHIVLVGADAEADVERYLQDVRPPELLIHRRPHGPTLTGLPTYFSASVPVEATRPVGFGSSTVSESITLDPRQVDWAWGDGSSSGWLPSEETAEHRYLSGGVQLGTLTTRWGATYTATFEGRTVGPFTATGTVDRSQPFTEPVDTSDPTLVSGHPPG